MEPKGNAEAKSEDVEYSVDDVTSVDMIDCGDYFLIESDLDPDKDENVIKIVCISDTHNKHNEIKNIPSGDILIHSGDITMYGKLNEIENYDKWIENLVKIEKKYKYAILVAGNHDITLEEDYYNTIGYINFHDGKKENVAKCNKIAKNGNSIYIEDNVIELYGIKFYGSPYQPEFCEWAFNLPRGEQLAKEWSKIPENGIDVLITHGPPKYHGDKVKPQFSMNTNSVNYYGCNDLLKRVCKIGNIKYHIFGHIHQGFGVTKQKGINTLFINACILNSNYFYVNKPIMFYIKGKRKKKDKNDDNDKYDMKEEKMDNVEDINGKNKYLKVVTKEIIEVHEFFVNWFNGVINEKDKLLAFKQFESRFDDNYSMNMPPSPSALDYKAVMESIRSAYKSEIDTGFKIDIKNIKLLNIINDKEKINSFNLFQQNIDINKENLIFAEYEQYQQNDANTKNTKRKSYAVFNIDTKNLSPNGLKWRIVNQEWIKT